MSQATQRATMPKGTHAAMENRTVFNANRNLIGIVKHSDSILDIGCGSGSITASLAELAGSEGSVTGIDTSEHLIEIAKEQYKNISNVHFELADVLHFSSPDKFNIVSAARLLQWVANPAEILDKAMAILKADGYLSILDYNHKKIIWSPAIPVSMQVFYKAFLQWRKDAGMDNEIADHLAAMFTDAGLKNITVTGHSEISNKRDEDFESRVSIWAIVAETRGRQLATDGYITEKERMNAIHDYRDWIAADAQTMSMYLLAVTAQK